MSKWTVDTAHSSVEFTVRHMMITTVRGSFNEFDAEIEFDENNPSAASVVATVKTASVDTRNKDRDAHLRSADFFESDVYENMTFKSTGIEVTGDNTGKITGDLTIRDVTKEVVLDTELLGHGPDPFGGYRAGFTASTTINREDFGLTWNQALETGGVLVSKDVKISLDIQAVKVTEAQPA